MDAIQEYVVYTAGAFRGANHWEQEQNIRRAEALSLEVWRRGFPCVSPHCNTRNFQGAAPDDVWLAGDLVILSKCDAILLVPGWEKSSGTIAEVEYAKLHGIPVFHTLDALVEAYSNGQ